VINLDIMRTEVPEFIWKNDGFIIPSFASFIAPVGYQMHI